MGWPEAFAIVGGGFVFALVMAALCWDGELPKSKG